jgi:pyruvate/2-oxoglutarate dehydrogenase complex dihydrolipoamide dehydrogenase (E3) component
MTVLARSRAQSVKRDGDQVTVTLTDGREVTGSHCLLAVGSLPDTAGIGLEDAGVRLNQVASSRSIGCRVPRHEVSMQRETVRVC